MPDAKSKIDNDIAKIYCDISKKKIPNFKEFLELEVSAEDPQAGCDAIMPTVRYRYR